MAKSSEKSPAQTPAAKPGELSEEERAKLASMASEAIEVEAFDFEARFTGIEQRLDAILQRLEDMPTEVAIALDTGKGLATRADVERVRDELTACIVAGARPKQARLERGELPEEIRVRTRDRRARHLSAGIAFGREWRTLLTAELTDEQLETLTHDPVLKVEEGAAG